MKRIVYAMALTSLVPMVYGQMNVTRSPKTTDVVVSEKELDDAYLADLRAQLTKRGTHQDLLRAEKARDELGFVLLEQESYREAASVFEVGIATLPFPSARAKPYRLGLGIALFHLGQFEDALESLTLADNYNISESYTIMGRIHERNGHPEKAIQSYEKAIAADVRDREPVLRLSLIRTLNGQEDAAITTLIDRSPFVGRDAIMLALETNPDWRPLQTALKRSGKISRLEEAKVLEIKPPTLPTKPERKMPR